MVSKKDMQKTAPEDCQRQIYEELEELEEQGVKQALVPEGETERARTMQRVEVTRTMSPWSDHARSSSGSSSSSLAPDTVFASSASSRIAQEMEEAKSEPSWTSLAREKERD